MKLLSEEKQVGDLVKRKSPLVQDQKTGIVLKKGTDVSLSRILIAFNDGTILWATDWNYWKIVKKSE